MEDDYKKSVDLELEDIWSRIAESTAMADIEEDDAENDAV